MHAAEHVSDQAMHFVASIPGQGIPVMTDTSDALVRELDPACTSGVATKDAKRVPPAGPKQNIPLACRPSESILSAAEKCIDYAVDRCFVVDDNQRLLGSISLDAIRQAILDGDGLDCPLLGQHLAVGEPGKYAQDEAGMWSGGPDGVLTPIVDAQGCLVDVRLDRSKGLVQVAKPNLSHHEFRFLLEAFLSSWISGKGPHLRAFEENFSSWVGKKHGIAVANGTVALHLALAALGIGPGDEVIVPDLTFAATINAVLYCGATPVIVDIDKRTWGMSVATAASAMTSRTKAIIPVHLYGRPTEIGPLAELAKAHKCFIVEDCAEAHGARYAGRVVGGFSDISCFSFHSNKVVTTGEGGMCLLDSDSLAEKATELRDHGMAEGRIYWHDQIGFNYRMTNLQAAIGLAQLSRAGGMIKRNRELEVAYRAHLADIPDIAFPPPLGDEYEPVVWLVCVQVPSDKRARLIAKARAMDVELRPFFYPLSTMPLYQCYAPRRCVNSVELAARGLNLPTSNSVDAPVMEKIAAIFHSILA
jgi:perosamine synthetase